MLKIVKISVFLILTWVSLLLLPEEKTTFFNENFHNYKDNLAEAISDDKLAIFVFFYLEDCPFCHKMRKQVLNQSDVIDFYHKYFLNYELNANGSLEIIDFEGNTIIERDFASKKNNVFATPVLVFFDLTGKVIAYRTGFLTKEDFLLLGLFVKNKKYLNTNFISYKRKMKL